MNNPTDIESGAPIKPSRRVLFVNLRFVLKADKEFEDGQRYPLQTFEDRGWKWDPSGDITSEHMLWKDDVVMFIKRNVSDRIATVERIIKGNLSCDSQENGSQRRTEDRVCQRAN